MNRMEERLRAAIAKDGPITLDQYMAVALTDQEDGYYTRGDGIGATGDFITAPEISQMFGELIGLWMADMWQRMGAPKETVIAELGPGRGTLMADALRAMRRAAPDLVQNASLRLVEASPVLRRMQTERLAEFSPGFVDDFDELPDQPMLLVANEFLDALPIRQLVKRGKGWAERAVGVGAEHLEFVEIDPPMPVPGGLPPMAEGEIMEISPSRLFVAGEVAEHVTAHGGAALFIDYGHGLTAPGDTLQAMKGHGFHSLLETPGEADITSHVDFAAAADMAEDLGATVHGPIGQRQFLLRLGIEARLAQLLKGATPDAAEGLTAGFRRLTDPQHMGHLFKVMCLSHPEIGTPTGYVAEEAYSTGP